MEKKRGDFVRIRGNYRPNEKIYMIFDISINSNNIEKLEIYHIVNIKNLHDFTFCIKNQIIEHIPKPDNLCWLMIKRADMVLKKHKLK